MAGYQELQLWQKAVTLVKQVYALTRTFPIIEQYALTTQINRSVVSVPSNIAEGWARNSTKDFVRFLCIARGSLAEMETQLIIARDLGYITSAEAESVLDSSTELGKMISASITSLKTKIKLAKNL